VELPGFDLAEEQQVAWRETPEFAKSRTVADFIDPCEYFDVLLWGNLGSVVDAMDGKHGDDSRDYFRENSSFFQSTDKSGKKWFRYFQRVQSTNDPSGFRESNIFWSEESGFHPICRLYATSTNKIIGLVQLRWKLTDGVYYPVESYQVSNENDGTLSYRRKMTASNLAINKPVKKDQFSYSALGLKNGDVLVDRIEESVYTIQKNKPVFVAKFYADYQSPPPTLPTGSISGIRWVAIGLGIVLIILGLYLMYLNAKKNQSPE
jgi:hypothetical protein